MEVLPRPDSSCWRWNLWFRELCKWWPCACWQCSVRYGSRPACDKPQCEQQQLLFNSTAAPERFLGLNILYKRYDGCPVPTCPRLVVPPGAVGVPAHCKALDQVAFKGPSQLKRFCDCVILINCTLESLTALQMLSGGNEWYLMLLHD